MDPQLKHWIGLWDYLDGNFWALWNWTTRNLTPDDVSWQPAPTVASIGWNLQHLAEILDYYFLHVFGHTEPVQASPLLTMRQLRRGRLQGSGADRCLSPASPAALSRVSGGPPWPGSRQAPGEQLPLNEKLWMGHWPHCRARKLSSRHVHAPSQLTCNRPAVRMTVDCRLDLPFRPYFTSCLSALSENQCPPGPPYAK
jgi:hypothetical protein